MLHQTQQSYVVTVLGGGSFGTALANIIATNGHRTCLWLRNAERAAVAQRTRGNADYLPGHTLHNNLTVTADLDAAVRHCQTLVLAVPSQSYREVVRAAAPFLRDDCLLVSATKGIEGGSFTRMSEILEQELGERPIGVLSGPNFAKEIVQNQYTGSVIASQDEEILARIPRLFSSNTFRVYTNRDRIGVELAGALKNIYAIIAGMAIAMGSGFNTQSMILTRSLAEMGRFAKTLGADPATFLGLAGVGDLFLTCSSDLSRNYRIGFALGHGHSLEQAIRDVGQVAEGVNTLKIVKSKADELGVYMPLASGLYAVMFQGRNIEKVIKELMSGAMASDVEYSQQP